jgi:hypothetical protein
LVSKTTWSEPMWSSNFPMCEIIFFDHKQTFFCREQLLAINNFPNWKNLTTFFSKRWRKVKKLQLFHFLPFLATIFHFQFSISNINYHQLAHFPRFDSKVKFILGEVFFLSWSRLPSLIFEASFWALFWHH